MKYSALLLLAFLGLAAAASIGNQAAAVAEVQDDEEDVPADNDDSSSGGNVLVKVLQDKLAGWFQKIKERVDVKKEKATDLAGKATEVIEALKEHKAKLGEKAKAFIETYKGNALGIFGKLIEAFNRHNQPKDDDENAEERRKREVQEDEEDDMPAGEEKKTLAEHINGVLEKTVQKFKEHADDGHARLNKFLKKLFEGVDALKSIGSKVNEKVKQSVETYKGNHAEFMDMVKDRISGKNTDDADDIDEDAVSRRKRESGLLDLAREVKNNWRTMSKDALERARERIGNRFRAIRGLIEAALNGHHDITTEAWDEADEE